MAAKWPHSRVEWREVGEGEEEQEEQRGRWQEEQLTAAPSGMCLTCLVSILMWNIEGHLKQARQTVTLFPEFGPQATGASSRITCRRLGTGQQEPGLTSPAAMSLVAVRYRPSLASSMVTSLLLLYCINKQNVKQNRQTNKQDNFSFKRT